MKTSMTTHRIFAILAILVVIFGGLFLTPGTVLADTGSSTPHPSEAPTSQQDQRGRTSERLQTMYQRELDRLDLQAQHLQRADDLAEKASTLLDKAEQNGKDVSGLRSALALFKAQLKTAQLQHDTAAGILQHHAGFAEDGTLTNIAAARITVTDAHQSLQAARQTLTEAVHDLRNALQLWRQNNPRPDAGSNG